MNDIANTRSITSNINDRSLRINKFTRKKKKKRRKIKLESFGRLFFFNVSTMAKKGIVLLCLFYKLQKRICLSFIFFEVKEKKQNWMRKISQ